MSQQKCMNNDIENEHANDTASNYREGDSTPQAPIHEGQGGQGSP